MISLHLIECTVYLALFLQPEDTHMPLFSLFITLETVLAL